MAWLLKQDTYTLHRAARKRFPRNPYTVNNINNICECDLVDVQGLTRYNDGVKYLLTVIDVFSKFLHIIPLKRKTGTAVTSAFQSILNDPRYMKPIRKRPVWLRTDRGKKFLNRSFQDMLKREGIQFQICKNPDVKCSVFERAHRTIRDKLYKYFTYKTRTDLLTYSRTSCETTTLQFTVQLVWLQPKLVILIFMRYGKK
jgi:hypothetical protein